MSTRVHSDVFFTNFTHFAIAITASKDMVLKTKSSPFELSFDLIRRFLTFSNINRLSVIDTISTSLYSAKASVYFFYKQPS